MTDVITTRTTRKTAASFSHFESLALPLPSSRFFLPNMDTWSTVSKFHCKLCDTSCVDSKRSTSSARTSTRSALEINATSKYIGSLHSVVPRGRKFVSNNGRQAHSILQDWFVDPPSTFATNYRIRTMSAHCIRTISCRD